MPATALAVARPESAGCIRLCRDASPALAVLEADLIGGCVVAFASALSAVGRVAVQVPAAGNSDLLFHPFYRPPETAAEVPTVFVMVTDTVPIAVGSPV